MIHEIYSEMALISVNSFLKEIDDNKFFERQYMEGSEELDRIIKEIEGLLRAMFPDNNKNRIAQYYNAYSHSRMSERDKQERYFRKVKRTKNNLLSLKKELNLYISSKSEKENKGEENVNKPSLTQMNFHGNIENFALGDMNNYNTSIYLNALITAIEESEDIPSEEKRDLIAKIKNIVTNPYVSGIGTSLIVEAIKTTLIGK